MKKITKKAIEGIIKKYVVLYNQKKFAEVCLLYSDEVVYIDETGRKNGRKEVLNYFKSSVCPPTTGYKLSRVSILPGGEMAIVYMDFITTLKTQDGEIRRGGSSLFLLKLIDGNPYIAMETSKTYTI